MIRIVFMGSPYEVLEPLKRLGQEHVKGNLNLVAVVSQPARPTGRGGQVQDPPVAAYAKEKKIQCLQPESAKSVEFLVELQNLKPDIIVTAAYGQILSDDFLKIPLIATINIHPSRLPAYRGATPVPAAILDGLTETSVSILFTVKKLDAGDIIIQKDFQIENHETSGELTLRLFAESSDLLMDAIHKITSKERPVFTPQDSTKVTFCKKITKEMGQVIWSLNKELIFNRFRAFEPWPGSWTLFQGKRITITKMSIFDESAELPKNLKVGGSLFHRPSKSILVSCGNGYIALSRLKPAGSKEMDAVSFWNGIKDKSDPSFEVLDVPQ